MIFNNQAVRLSRERIKALQILLKEQTGKDYTAEEAQKAGVSIIRFVLAKEQRNQELKKDSIKLNKMTKPDDKQLTERKETFAKSSIGYSTIDEYKEAIHNLIGYFEVLIEMDKQFKDS